MFIRKEDQPKREDKEIIRDNFVVVHALLGLNKTGIFKRTTLAQLLVDYDKDTNFDISRALGPQVQRWVDSEATFVSNLFQDLKRLRRNARDGARSPPWLATLYKLLDEGSDTSPMTPSTLPPPKTTLTSPFKPLTPQATMQPVFNYDSKKEVAIKAMGGKDWHVRMVFMIMIMGCDRFAHMH